MSNVCKVKVSDLSPGDKLSRLAYYEVVKTNNDCAIVKNENDFKFQISNGIVENEMYSANQVKLTKKVSRTQLVEILEKAGDTVFTVTFYKQPTEKRICELLKSFDFTNATKADRKTLAKNFLHGEYRTLIGYLVHTEPKTGRSQVVDLEIPKGTYNRRLIDHRTLESIIIKNTKYIVK